MLRKRWTAAKHHEATILGVLLLTLVLTGLLAYQAQQAARSHRQSAEAALSDYASFASWELGRRLDAAIASTLNSALLQARMSSEIMIVTDMLAAHDEQNLKRFQSALAEDLTACGCADAVHDFFAVDLETGANVQLQRRLPESFGEWLTTVLLPEARLHRTAAIGEPAIHRRGVQPAPTRIVHTRNRDSMPVAPVPGNAGGGPAVFLRQMERGAEPGIFSVRDVPGAGDARAVYAFLRDRNGVATAIYGFVLDVPEFVQPVARSVVETADILPPSLTRGLRNDEILALRIATGSGRELYQTPHAVAGPTHVSDTVTSSVVRLATDVSVRSDMAALLVIGGLPGSRIPALASLFLLALCLVVIAMIQLRRQHALGRLRSDFVSSVSHELRTPLAQISLFAQLLELRRLHPAQRQRAIRIINEEAHRLKYLVENVLQFARTERHAHQVTTHAVACAPLIRDIVDRFEPLARARSVSLQLQLDEQLVAMADENALRQILLNLLDNAVKYGPSGQVIVVSARADAGDARIAVEDQGPGIPAADRDQVWEAYRRLDRDIESSTAGSGIGLAVVRELVQLHGGSVSIEDGSAGGARFVIRLALCGGSTALDRQKQQDDPTSRQAMEWAASS